MKRLLMAAVVVAGCGASATAHAPFVYSVPPHVGTLVVDDAAFVRFAHELRRDVEADLAAATSPTAKRTKDERFVLAMLDALDDHWDAAVAGLDRIREAETDPAARAMTGLSIRIWADARAHGGDSPGSFRAALERGIASLPVDLVRAELGMLRAMGQAFTPEVCQELVETEVGPHVKTGAVTDLGDVWAIVFQRYAVKRLVQVGPIIDAVLGAHGIELPHD